MVADSQTLAFQTFAFTPSAANEIKPGIHRTALEGLFYIAPADFHDERGYYAELSRIPEIDTVLDQPFQMKQLNLSHSRTNVIRGLHAEAWNKLISIVHGTAFCAWVDVRPDSETFGDTVTMTMGHDDAAVFGTMYVAEGIANSFLVTDGPLEYVYAVDQLYSERDPAGDVALHLFDPHLDIEWPLEKDKMIMSERDRTASSFDTFFERD